MWDLILNPFVTVITVLYSIFGNVVVAIIIFTILVRLLMYPLNIQQMRSSKAMQALPPELKKLQEKYKNDREKLAQEQMALYRQHGINPLGGCLPLLIQFPIWIGLYQAINHALAATPLQLIDLGGRFLVGGLDHLVPLNNVWLGMDLTQPPTPPTNPVFALALPLLVLVTTWVQSKLITPPTPSGEDGQPNQAAAMTQSMTTIMPIMMGFFSLSFSVGLSIYFVVSNLFTIAQYSLQGQADWRRLLRLKKPDGEGADTVSGTARPKKPADSPAKPEKKAADKTTQPKSKTQRAKPAK
jgi:YidC/Oxa1 family membrane protein insertase